jgi:hypothetical protein
VKKAFLLTQQSTFDTIVNRVVSIVIVISFIIVLIRIGGWIILKSSSV